MPSVAIIGTRGYPSYYGGFETAVRKLAPHLVENGWDVTVYGRPGALRLEDPSRDPRVEIAVTRGIERKSLSTLSYGFTATLDSVRKRPDVALVMNVANGFWLPMLRRAGIPTLVNVDGIEWDRDKWGWFAKRLFHSGARWTAKHGDALVFDSEEIARRWREEFHRTGTFIPYGGDASGADLDVEPGLSHRGYALLVARFVPENTVAEFFEAVPQIAEQMDVVIVGSTGYGGGFDEEAAHLAARHERVQWLGHVSNDNRLHALWKHAGVYFHGHSVGGTNPALVQAMALGAPVIARDTVYNREVLGADGIFVAPDSREISAAVIGLSRENAELMSSRLVQRASAHYTWDGVNSKYALALRELIGSSQDERTDRESSSLIGTDE